MEPPIEDHSMNNDVPIDVSEAEDPATQSTVEQSRYPVWMK